MRCISCCETPEAFILLVMCSVLSSQQHGLNAQDSCCVSCRAAIIHWKHFNQMADLYRSACARSPHYPAHQHTREGILGLARILGLAHSENDHACRTKVAGVWLCDQSSHHPWQEWSCRRARAWCFLSNGSLWLNAGGLSEVHEAGDASTISGTWTA